MDDMVHVFEKAGLGKAPFRFVRTYEAIYQACQGAPIQAAGMCQYCGACIRQVCVVRGADGREFNVGCDCVEKTGDSGLRKAINKMKLAARHRREAARIAAAKEAIKAAEVQARLRDQPHPYPDFAAKGKSLLDWAMYSLEFGGNKAGISVAKLVGV